MDQGAARLFEESRDAREAKFMKQGEKMMMK
jgi:hypothetical protein